MRALSYAAFSNLRRAIYPFDSVSLSVRRTQPAWLNERPFIRRNSDPSRPLGRSASEDVLEIGIPIMFGRACRWNQSHDRYRPVSATPRLSR